MEAEAGGGGVGLVEVLDALVEIVLDGREGRHNGWRTKAVGDHGEVGEVLLDGRVQDRLGTGVAQGGPVLVQKVHQLLADHSEISNEISDEIIDSKFRVGAIKKLL